MGYLFERNLGIYMGRWWKAAQAMGIKQWETASSLTDNIRSEKNNSD